MNCQFTVLLLHVTVLYMYDSKLVLFVTDVTHQQEIYRLKILPVSSRRDYPSQISLYKLTIFELKVKTFGQSQFHGFDIVFTTQNFQKVGILVISTRVTVYDCGFF